MYELCENFHIMIFHIWEILLDCASLKNSIRSSFQGKWFKSFSDNIIQWPVKTTCDEHQHCSNKAAPVLIRIEFVEDFLVSYLFFTPHLCTNLHHHPERILLHNGNLTFFPPKSFSEYILKIVTQIVHLTVPLPQQQIQPR